MACLSNGNSSAPLPHPLWQNFPMWPVTGSSEDGSHGTPSRRTWVQKKSLQSSTTGTLPEEAVWQGPTDPLARFRSSSSEEIISGPTYDEKATPIGSANTRSHLGPCNSLRCEMAPWRDWTSLTYVWPLSVEGDLPLKYRSREISSKQYGAGQCQQISDVFLKQGRSFL